MFRFQHYLYIRYSCAAFTHCGAVPRKNGILYNTLLPKVNHHRMFVISPKAFCLSSNPSSGAKSDPSGNDRKSKADTSLSYKLRLKRAVKDYGATVIVFHVTISLASLGVCYLAVSNGLDVAHLLSIIGFSKDVISSTILTGGSTMVISYAIHKLFAPVRILTTLTATPFIVQYLRKIGILKLKTTKI